MEEKEIKAKLLGIGMSPELKGFTYVAKAIELYSASIQITGENGLYGIIAQEYNDNCSRVERAIRHSIQVLFTKYGIAGVIAKSKRIWSIASFGLLEKETENSEFISLLNFESVQKIKEFSKEGETFLFLEYINTN